MFFSRFPLTYHTFDGKSATLITDFMRRVSLPQSVKDNAALYEIYTIEEGDTPEIVADKVYSTATLHWVILLVNEIIDPRFDWCMTQQNLAKYCQNKYDDIYAVHHYETSDGIVVDADFPGAYPVSNFEYEDNINESKRQIKILNPVFIKDFVQQFENTINS